MAQEIYKYNYWNPLNLYGIQRQITANKIFDIAVNMGIRPAGKILQKSCNKIIHKYLSSKLIKLKVDGIVGRVTLNVVNKINEYVADDFIDMICKMQKNRYLWIVSIRPTQMVFLKGWLRRAKWRGQD